MFVSACVPLSPPPPKHYNILLSSILKRERPFKKHDIQHGSLHQTEQVTTTIPQGNLFSCGFVSMVGTRGLPAEAS